MANEFQRMLDQERYEMNYDERLIELRREVQCYISNTI